MQAAEDKKREEDLQQAAKLADGTTGNGLYEDPGKLMQASYVDPNAPDNALRQRAFVSST